MEVIVNDKPHQTAEKINIQELLNQLNLPSQQGIAVAINQAIVPKSEWEHIQLSDQDKIMIITATQGG
ncbi:MAG: sulfur carrier protein ThiS [Flammeovirgaceae bacterium]